MLGELNIKSLLQKRWTFDVGNESSMGQIGNDNENRTVNIYNIVDIA